MGKIENSDSYSSDSYQINHKKDFKINQQQSLKLGLLIDSDIKLLITNQDDIKKFKKACKLIELSNPKAARLLEQCLFTLDEDGDFHVSMPVVPELISFNQAAIINDRLPANLKKFDYRFNGLCELICNKVILDDLLGKTVSGENYLKKEITPEKLNKETIIKSHLIDVFSVFHKIIAFLFRIYPDNLFSFTDQWNLTVSNGTGLKVNREILKTGLEDIDVGTTLKIEVFSKSSSGFSGHSLLVITPSPKGEGF